MQIIGKEDASLCLEENSKPCLTISQLNWHQLLNDVIVNRIFKELQESNIIKKYDTRYITINKTKIPNKSIVSAKFKASIKEGISGIENYKYDVISKDVEVKNFYNHIVELFEFYAHELDTDINNIELELIDLEIIQGKPLTRIKIFCADDDYFNDYIETIKKYSMDDIEIRKNENGYGYCTDLYIESLDFLLDFVEDIKKLNSSKEPGQHNGFIFSMIEKGYYSIEIYNGWIE